MATRVGNVKEGGAVDEQLHTVRGRLDVARDLIDRAAVGLLLAGSDRRVLDQLSEATNALGAAAACIDDELRLRGLGPAA
jgi:hypothetical protein